MAGFRAVLIMLLPIVIPALVLLNVWSLRRKHVGWKELVTFVVALAFLVIGCFLFGRRAYAMHAIHSLRVSDVNRVYIDHQEVTDSGTVATIIQSLNGADWYVSQHGGWTRQARLEIFLRSGKTQTVFIGDIPLRGGAVLGFSQDAGDAFCNGLSLEKITPRPI